MNENFLSDLLNFLFGQSKPLSPNDPRFGAVPKGSPRERQLRNLTQQERRKALQMGQPGLLDMIPQPPTPTGNGMPDFATLGRLINEASR